MRKRLLLLTGLTLILFTPCNIGEEDISDERIIRVKTVYGQQLITGFDIPFTAKEGVENDITAQANFYISGQTVNQEHTYSFLGSVSTDYNLNNCAVVAFVIDNNEPSKIINIQLT